MEEERKRFLSAPKTISEIELIVKEIGMCLEKIIQEIKGSYTNEQLSDILLSSFGLYTSRFISALIKQSTAETKEKKSGLVDALIDWLRDIVRTDLIEKGEIKND